MGHSELFEPTKRGQRRWWIAAGVALFLTAYAAMDGPIMYGFTRHWIPHGLLNLYEKPLEWTIYRIPVLGGLQRDYRTHWNQLAIAHMPKGASLNFDTPSGPREVRFLYHEVSIAGFGSTSHADGSRSCFFGPVSQEIIVVEQTRILFRDRPVATIPATAQLIEIEYAQDELKIDVDGRSIPIDQ